MSKEKGLELSGYMKTICNRVSKKPITFSEASEKWKNFNPFTHHLKNDFNQLVESKYLYMRGIKYYCYKWVSKAMDSEAEEIDDLPF